MSALRKFCVGVVLVVVFVLVCGVGVGFGASGVWWGLYSGSWPSNLPQGGTGRIIVSAQNRGYLDVDGTDNPVVLKDVLPPGLSAVSVEGVAGKKFGATGFRGVLGCKVTSLHAVECEFSSGELPPFEILEMRILVRVGESANAGESNVVSVVGGGAAKEGVLSRPISVGEETQFGLENYEFLPEEEGGGPVTQAGKHPFQVTGVVALNTSVMAADPNNQEPAGLAKDFTIQVPPGLIGNPTPIAQCTDSQFTKEEQSSVGGAHNLCEPQTAIGVANVTFDLPGGGTHLDARTVPVFNLTPQPGEPARFGFEVVGVRAYLDTSVRTGSDYGVTLKVSNLPQLAGLLTSKVTLWGVPGAAVHNRDRGWACLFGESSCPTATQSEPPPFLSMPASCLGELRSTIQIDSWAEPNPASPETAPLERESLVGGLDGCGRLQFKPEIQIAPDIPNASSPAGLEVLVHIPQTATLNPEGLAEATVKDTTVALPEGVAVNPGGADGLLACSEEQVGYQGKSAGEPDLNLFTPGVSGNPCPDASKIGTVEIETPLLPHVLKGAAYLASQNANPFGSLLAMYLVVDDKASGTIVKQAGEVMLNENTGQLVSTFKNVPQLPFENLRLHFFGESRAPLGTPALCGAYTTVASFAPWSGNPPSEASSTFNIGPGPNGSACPNPGGGRSLSELPFSPSLTAGSTNIQAGAFTSFATTMSREDGNEDLQAIQLHLPKGLSGTLSGVELCPEPQASLGTCGPNSLIGETTVSVGLGSNPYSVTGGKVYITGPYNGAPFGLSIVNPAKAGPFDIGKGACDCVLVRATIQVDPLTAALTITTDSAGQFAIPHMLDGIPLEIKHVNVTVTRPGFTFNPTNCSAMKITGTMKSFMGASSGFSVPFQVTNCATLKFKPQFAASTASKTSRKNGASLHVKLAYPKAVQGSQANIAAVKVDLPKQLPSRLTTLQKACLAKTFNENPAACPPGSKVGTAFTRTPIIPVPLAGPAYFVSNGGAKFPELVVILQGYGVTVQLHGETFINKKGITSSTFRTVPDVPVDTFELTLPEAANSALAANGDLCKAKLLMPTAFTAQNGTVVRQSTKITVTGCPKTVKIKKHKGSKNNKKR